MIEVKNLSKIYDNNKVLDAVGFSLKQGEALGILGPNGAGKTTLLKIISRLIQPSEGEIKLDRLNQTELGTIFEDQRFLGHLSGLKNIEVFMNSIGFPNAFDLENAFKEFGLWEKRYVNYKKYSTGMKKRLDLLSIFCCDKRLLLLDEPINGLDIEGMLLLDKKILEQKREGRSFIISSHYAAHLEKICDYFMIVSKGKVLAYFKKEELLETSLSLEDKYQTVLV